MKNDNHLQHMRHSAAHLLAAAVQMLYPDVKLGIGPAIENGFYYDFKFKNPISEDDLPKIEQKMRELLKTWKGFERQEKSIAEAQELEKEQPYKLDLISDFAQEHDSVSFYKSGGFVDLCKGGHVEYAKEIGKFKLLSIAGAYWKGSEKNDMLTRIYGAAFPTQAELDKHLQSLEVAKKRDHKKLGKELDLFVFSETVGKGLPLWTPKGSTIRRILERFIVDEELKRGYFHVYTPDIANLALYKKSGHYPYYKESMYAPIGIDEEEYMLRPMTCPHHFELYLSQPHSYRELPLRYAELAHLYRYEKSGELAGLERVRTFTLADAHIIARADQAANEVNGVLDLIDYVAKCLGLQTRNDYFYRLSLGDRNDEKKYFKDDKAWNNGEDILRTVLKNRNAHYYEAKGEAAFYGPKIDVQMKNVNGKEETAFTVQYDFVMPKRFGLTYINAEGKEEQPMVIHRSSIGAIERVMAFLIEKHAGAFPLWLSPVQVAILPIADRHFEAAKLVFEELNKAGIRVELNDRKETLQGKIRASTLQKVPYMCIIGDKEVEKGNFVSIRTREGKDLGQQDVSNFLQQLKDDIDKKA